MSDEDKRKPDESGEAEAAKPDSGGDDTAASDDELTVEDILAEASDDGQAAEDTVAVLQATLEERTRDLQRLNAEFQNYRKRVERDKTRAGELATAAVLSSLLPVLDDLDRARDHGDLVGPFGSVAEQLIGTLTKQGLSSFGEKGDGFDPTIHEAVAHMQMSGVDGPTCIDVMRRGYKIGDRLLRAAMVAVADAPDEPAEEPTAEPEAADEADESPEAADGEGEETAEEAPSEESERSETKGADDGEDAAEDPKSEKDS